MVKTRPRYHLSLILLAGGKGRMAHVIGDSAKSPAVCSLFQSRPLRRGKSDVDLLRSRLLRGGYGRHPTFFQHVGNRHVHIASRTLFHTRIGGLPSPITSGKFPDHAREKLSVFKLKHNLIVAGDLLGQLRESAGQRAGQSPWKALRISRRLDMFHFRDARVSVFWPCQVCRNMMRSGDSA